MLGVEIERVSKSDGEQIAANLTARVDLDGTYWLVARPEDPSRYLLTPAHGNKGEFRAMVGLDRERGRSTLLLNTTEAVIMLGATIAPF
jgi:hypothetical protein